ncbi:rod shape-determining protein [Streptomyces pristinaespiralis]|uniref:Rod shape-determining protein MreC n=2 Tax=Streptomyces pristinaespiralis TaxID=38300 RepID=A0A0M4DYG0_STRPR|nr:rod shape-determining protein [Streptomyces pristinaespiralis]ALC24912.1 rod shape-determining protein MreC [Streptomyces pristinaespiralis]QMU12797.1 rod shape-determining protein [Streptomyces pristinaespiralis]
MTGFGVRPGGRRRSARPVCRTCPRFAIDIGSSRTRAWSPGRGVVLDVPTVTSPGAEAVYPVRRGDIVDPEGTARMLERLFRRRVPGFSRPLIVITTPVLGGPRFRSAALTALEVLHPRTVLTVPTAKAIALGAGADLGRPLLVADIGAHVTEVALLCDGEVTDAYRTSLGTGDIGGSVTFRDISGAVVAMVTDMLRLDESEQTLDALGRGLLLAGGGALRPEFTYDLTGRLRVPVQPVPAPHTAALRGASYVMESAHRHPATGAEEYVPERGTR